jgi:hypothetical protein
MPHSWAHSATVTQSSRRKKMIRPCSNAYMHIVSVSACDVTAWSLSDTDLQARSRAKIKLLKYRMFQPKV